ncbi:carboxymuconolactone decarboxylase family protein [Nocardia altamirensis]|uniref:carboxymuconolactone decarboxylase family protein n=1 Tax=Nocardia altamirensis TaxID=472158 RepID=UPI0008408748|nr:carboxymuconolactone decarboxylase family protein [Nocardia altamirensis]
MLSMLMHSQGTIQPWIRLGVALFTATILPTRSRELVILATCHAMDAVYEWRQHETTSASFGVTAEQRAAIQSENLDILDDYDRSLVQFATAVVKSPRIDEQAFAAVRHHLSDAEIVEAIHLCGYFWTQNRLASTLDVEIDPPNDYAVVAANVASWGLPTEAFPAE